jgi:hypothetical protein
MNETAILLDNGFIQGFPFVDHFRKDINKTSCVKVHTCYFLQRKDIVEDEYCGSIFIKVTKIFLPKSETKIFHNIQNALNYINEN